MCYFKVYNIVDVFRYVWEVNAYAKVTLCQLMMAKCYVRQLKEIKYSEIQLYPVILCNHCDGQHQTTHRQVHNWVKNYSKIKNIDHGRQLLLWW